MNPRTKAEIDRILEEMRRGLIELMQSNAAQAYLFGNLASWLSIGLAPDQNRAAEASVAYADAYRKLLVDEGATVINGIKTPWLADMTEAERQQVYEIIDAGLREGKATGVTESGVGTYPKGSIAADLQEFFAQRKSHASTVARTETGRILNIGTLEGYLAAGITEVDVLDDEGPNSCDECINANGQRWPIEYAMMNELQHPNCVRAFRAVVRGMMKTLAINKRRLLTMLRTSQ